MAFPDFFDGSRIVGYNGSQLVLEIGLHYGANTLFELSRVTLEHGSVHAVLAPNGFGKSSFLASVTRLDGFPDLSNGLIRSDWTGLDTHGEEGATAICEMLPVDYLLHKLRKRQDAIRHQIAEKEKELEECATCESAEQAAERLGFLYDSLAAICSSDLEVAATKALQDLGFMDRGFHTRTCGALSGGWMYKLKLASLVLSRPELLIIDEPSFLDQAATEWLVSFLSRETVAASNVIVLLVTHKEHLLKYLAKNILYICENGGTRQLHQFHGSYESFLLAREQEEAAEKRGERAKRVEEASETKADKHLRQVQLVHNSNYDKQLARAGRTSKTFKGVCNDKEGKHAKLIANRSQKAERVRLQLEAKVENHALRKTSAMAPLCFAGEAVYNSEDAQIVTLSNVTFDYSYEQGVGPPLFRDITTAIRAKDRIAIVGANGAGKSTLLKLILGELTPHQGEVRFPQALRLLYYPQNAAMELLLNAETRYLTATELVCKVAVGQVSINWHGRRTAIAQREERPSMSALQARSQLAQFGLKGNIANRTVDALSTGERTRLYLSLVFVSTNRPPNILILDEISDNLDLDTVHSLTQALKSFPGAVVAVSHEQTAFLRHFATRVWTLKNGDLSVATVAM